MINNRLNALARLLPILLIAALVQTSAFAHRHHRHVSHHSHREAHSRSSSRRSGDRAVASVVSRGVVGTRDPEAFRSPVPEVRGMWVTRFSLTSPAEVRNVVATARRFGFNTLFVQIRGDGESFYNSTIEPRSEDLARQPLSFDPLADVISQAHASGIQVHAWLNTCFVWSGSRRPKSAEHVLNAHPDWFDRNSDGNFSTSPTNQCEGAFLSPANPAARAYLHDIFLDVVKHYNVDGIHFDYIRYPNETYDYGKTTLQSFSAQMLKTDPAAPGSAATQAAMVAYAKANADAFADWRRQQVTTLVEDTCRDAKAIRPNIICSAAVFANWKDAYVNRGQDWHRWLADGALDAVLPMAYSSDTAVVADQIRDAEATAAAAGRFCYAGLGAWHISADSTVQKIQAARAMGAQGFVLFSYGGVTKDGSSMTYLSKVIGDSCQHPATLPAMAWLKPAAAAVTAADSDANIKPKAE